MTKRITISLPDDVYEFVRVWAEENCRTAARVGAIVVTRAAKRRRRRQKRANDVEAD